MKLAFLIYHYFPYGGQQRDFLRVLKESVARGHQARVYTMGWEGEQPQGVDIEILSVKAWRRHTKYERFAQEVARRLAEQQVDAVIGFNRMPGLDIYYAADSCFAEKVEKGRGAYYRFTGRARHFLAFERAVFGEGSRTSSLVLSPLQKNQYVQHYPTCAGNLYEIPPGIGRDRQAPGDLPARRAAFRQQHGFAHDDLLILQVGSGFVIKGVDRSLRAIAALPEHLRSKVTYLLVGQDKPGRFLRLARQLGIADRCRFLGGRSDVPEFLFGCDLLLHPAYSESAGYTLLEATVAGLPVLTTDTCGYAFHVERAQSGQVSPSPFRQEDLDVRLRTMLEALPTSTWSANGITYGRTAELYDMPQAVMDLVEVLVSRGRSGKPSAAIHKEATA